MLYYYSPRMKLSGSLTIVVDFGNVPETECRKVFFMNSRQMYHFWHQGVISREWMPSDHIGEATSTNPAVRFDVCGSDEWIVAIERPITHPPMIAISEDAKATNHLWITMSSGTDQTSGASDNIMKDW